MDYYVATGVLVLGSLILGFFMGRRGLPGVVVDLTNIKNDIEDLKGKVNGQAQVVPPAAVPVVTPTV